MQDNYATLPDYLVLILHTDNDTDTEIVYLDTTDNLYLDYYNTTQCIHHNKIFVTVCLTASTTVSQVSYLHKVVPIGDPENHMDVDITYMTT